MRHSPPVWLLALIVSCAPSLALAQSDPGPFGDYRADSPGKHHLIRPGDLPPPYASQSGANSPAPVRRPTDARPSVPDGFTASLVAEGLNRPRVIRVAPDGTVFVAESGAGRILMFPAGGQAGSHVFASSLPGVFGIAFWPPGPSPRFVYAATTGHVVRFPYRSGQAEAAGPPETIVAELPTGGHWTRDLAFSPDGRRLFVSVGSGSNDADGLPDAPPGGIASWQAIHGLGAAWAGETSRAAVLAFDPNGHAVPGPVSMATGLRNCAGVGVQPRTGALWCVVNERDGMGDDLPPDYATHVAAGAFYGWPWFYIGNHPDPRHPGLRADLADKVTVPDVLIQPHSAPLGIAFYPETGSFPAAYRGDAFVTLHGSWNRAQRTGYKVIRLRLGQGTPDGGYEDFVTGFTTPSGEIWGRPVGVAVAGDGALLITEDGNGTVWRVAPK